MRNGCRGRSSSNSELKRRFIDRAGLGEHPSLWELVEAVRSIPYSRPSERTPNGVVTEWKGTCSTKHALLAELLDDRPALEFRLVHRVYRIGRDEAAERFGPRAAAAVPSEGLVDVHTYAIVDIDGRPTMIDVTFPSNVIWDGSSDMPLACGEGTDFPATGDPWARKAELVAEHCDRGVREPLIAALRSG